MCIISGFRCICYLCRWCFRCWCFFRFYLIFHHNFLNLPGIFHCELHVLSYQITIRGRFFPKCILPNRKHFNVMRFLLRSPTLYRFTVFVENCQFCARQFLTGNIRLGDLYLGNIVFHLDFLCFYGIFNGKCNAFRCHKTICWFCFCQGILLSDYQFFDDMSFFTGNPGIYNLTAFISYL